MMIFAIRRHRAATAVARELSARAAARAPLLAFLLLSCSPVLLLSGAARPVRADESEAVRAACEDDVILRAMLDELERSRTGLRLDGLADPYFIEFLVTDGVQHTTYASFGALLHRTDRRYRGLRADVRVGSYELDESNFGEGGVASDETLVIDGDYDAIRHGIWLTADAEYRADAETLDRKKAFMKSRMITDKPDDLSREDPVVDIRATVPVAVDTDRLERYVVPLSRVFLDYPDLQSSSVAAMGRVVNGWLVNTEGARIRLSAADAGIALNAVTQAPDGMRFSASIAVAAASPADFPADADAARDCRLVLDRLIALRDAPRLESYSGPVLFDAEAAAALFLRMFSDRFAGGQREVGGRTPPDDFANKLNERILPRWMSVTDDPTQQTIDGRYIAGAYPYDFQGVAPRSVNLVENGILKTLLMSRNPSKEFQRSTGHGRGYNNAAIAGCLIVSVEDGLDPDALKKELLDACREEGLDFGIRVSTLSEGSPHFVSYGMSFTSAARSYCSVVYYKVFLDGREEMVSGAEIARIDLKAFKRILAAGSQRCIYNYSGNSGQTAVVPALLFEELDLAVSDHDFDRPPILPSPLARKNQPPQNEKHPE